jgi:beta-mannosidase
MDLNHAFGFGPPLCDAVVATLSDRTGQILSRDYCFAHGNRFTSERDVGLSIQLRELGPDTIEAAVRSQRFARYVTVRSRGWSAEDQYFHLPPDVPHCLLLRRERADKASEGRVGALNSDRSCKFTIGS